ncbi:MAG: TonB-dependent receptor [Deltaproteobacteria bacterium]|nr:TonB-dependent receptor [Deltaproteobacteria bacterium]
MKKVLVLVLLFSVVVFSTVQAEDTKTSDTIVTMGEVVVTATRDNQETRKAPANVTVITAEEINNSGAATLVEVLENIEGVQFRSYSGNTAQAMIDMRGFGGDNPYGKTLILLDGRRLNRPDMSAASLMQIPLNNIESIEVVRGASSVLYGDAAIGGVINIITKRGKGAPQLNVSLAGGSYNFHDEKIGVSGSAGKLSCSFNGANQFSWGYRDRSKYSFSGGGFNIGYDASSFLALSLDGSLSKTGFEMPGGLTKSQMETNPRQIQTGHDNDDATENYQNLHGQVNTVLGNFGRLDTDFYYGVKTLRSNFASYWPPNQYNSYDIKTVGVTPKYILEKPIAMFNNKFTIGVDYYQETMTLDKYSDKKRTTQTHLVDFGKNTLGFYLRDEFYILPGLILTGGYRTESAQFKGKSTTLNPFSVDFDTDKKHNAEAWEGSLTYLFGKFSKVYVKYASVYRYPFLDEQASFYSSGPFNTFNINIEKEKGKSYEAGATVYPLDNLKIGATIYKIDMEDEISADPVTWELKNLDKTSHVGGEFNLSYVQKGVFSFYGNATYQKAVFAEGLNKDKEIPLVPNFMANANLEINLPFNISLNPRLRYIGKSFLANDYNNDAEQLKDHCLFDFFIYWRPEIKGRKVIVFAGVENLTDVKYATYGIDMAPWGENLYYPADGLLIKGGVSITF